MLLSKRFYITTKLENYAITITLKPKGYSIVIVATIAGNDRSILEIDANLEKTVQRKTFKAENISSL